MTNASESPRGATPSELTNDQISLLCEIGEHKAPAGGDSERRDLHRLLSEGYVQASSHSSLPAYALTPKGTDYLSKRGVGLNEA